MKIEILFHLCGSVVLEWESPFVELVVAVRTVKTIFEIQKYKIKTAECANCKQSLKFKSKE